MRHVRLNIAVAMLLALASGCGRRRVESTPDGRPPSPAPLDQVFVLESDGPPAEDTTVAIAINQGRVIILRRGAPDNSLFAEITIPDSSAKTDNGDTVRISIQPRPGIYGIDIVVNGEVTKGIVLTISYARFFFAPPEALEAYGSNLEFERALFIARVEEEDRVVFLPTTRPGSDLVSATLPGPGRYLVAAPRP